MSASVTAILVAYNSEKVIASAIASLLADAEVGRIIVVDNCSKDNTRDMIKRDFPKVTLIENPRNDGFGPANNIALTKVNTDYALLVNPDAVMNAGAVETLLETAGRYKDAAILAPALYDEEGNLHHSFKRNVFDRESARHRIVVPEGDICADFLSGAVMLFNMEIMRQVGFFDPNIFLYYEDDDICLRVRKAGYGLVYVPSARAVHLMGASSGSGNPEAEAFKQKHMAYSRLYIEEKYRGRPAAETLAARLHKQYAIKAALYMLQLNRLRTSRYRGRLAGIAEFIGKEKPRKAA